MFFGKVLRKLKWIATMCLMMVLLYSVYLTYTNEMGKDTLNHHNQRVFVVQSAKHEAPNIIAEIDVIAKQQHLAAWLRRRKVALLESSHTKVLLFCYMRGGSSFFGDIFRNNTEVSFWYEPVAPFYMAQYGASKFMFPQDIFWNQDSTKLRKLRSYPEWEVDAIVKYNHDLLTCNTTALPIETLSHSGMRTSSFTEQIQCVLENSKDVEENHCRDKYLRSSCRGSFDQYVNNNCHNYIDLVNKNSDKLGLNKNDTVENFAVLEHIPQQFIDFQRCRGLYYKNNVQPCVHYIVDHCQQSKLIAYKGLRYFMKHVGDMLENDPDMFVLYLVRDPRSIVSSRLKSRLASRASHGSPVTEAKYICAKIMDDLVAYKRLSETYKGVFKLVKYEDLIAHPGQVIQSLYSFLNHSIPKSVQDIITNGQVKNADSQANKWTVDIPTKYHKEMAQVCSRVILELGYRPAK